MKKRTLILMVLAVVAFGTIANAATVADKEKPKKEKKPKPAKNSGPDMIIHTNQGDIQVMLYAEKVPCTVGNFVDLAEKKFYDSTLFHRVIPSFMVQGGDPNSKHAPAGKMLGSGGPGYTFADEFDTSLKHDKKGLLSMANSGPNTNGSQFFITAVATPWLDGKHSVFGEVVSGYESVDKIINVKRNSANRPDVDQMILSIEIIKVKKLKKRIEAAKKALNRTCPTTPFKDYK